MAKKQVKVGRPNTVKWAKANVMWKNMTTSQIAKSLNTSYTNVFLHRKKLINDALLKGESAEKYECSKPAWSRAKKQKQTA